MCYAVRGEEETRGVLAHATHIAISLAPPFFHPLGIVRHTTFVMLFLLALLYGGLQADSGTSVKYS